MCNAVQQGNCHLVMSSAHPKILKSALWHFPIVTALLKLLYKHTGLSLTKVRNKKTVAQTDVTYCMYCTKKLY